MRTVFLLTALLGAGPLAAQEEKDPAWKAGYVFGQVLGYVLIAAFVYWGIRRLLRKGKKL